MSLRGIIGRMGQASAPELTAPTRPKYADLFATKDGKLSKSMTRCAEVCGPIAMGDSFEAVSAAEWSLEHMLALIVDAAPIPPTIRLSTWALAEGPVSRLLTALDQGIVAEVRIAAHWRADVLNSKGAFQMLRAKLVKAHVATGEIHAKIILADCADDSFFLACVTSANLTRNPRIETYQVDTHPDTWAEHCGWFDGWSSAQIKKST